MRLALLGPTHPWKGGIARHTTELAHRLAAAGETVDLLSWSAQYPGWLYPGEQRVPGDRPEAPPYDQTSYPLSWRRPDGWWRTGRALRRYDGAVLVLVTPVQVPAWRAVLAGTRGLCRSGVRRPRAVALCHNVLPHEARPGDRLLVRGLLQRVDGVLVHSDEQARLARELTSRPVVVASLPPHLPEVRPAPAGGAVAVGPAAAGSAAPPAGPIRLLFFGLVRPYKGLDVLLRALARVPDSGTLTVAGEFWGGTEATERLIAELGLDGRVLLRPGYVPAEEVSALFDGADAVVLPYRTATASQNVALAHAHGVPVLATTAGALGTAVTDGVDGLLCAPDDIDALASALRRLAEPGTLPRLRAGVSVVDPDPPWANYVATLVGLLGGRPDGDPDRPTDGPDGRRRP